MNSNKNVYSVKQINSYVKRMFEDDFVLRDIYIKGEISNCKYHYSGHIYFSLKDESGVISAVMFSSFAAKLQFRLEDGMQVVIRGSVSVYERDGKYQLYAKEAEKAGEGDLFKKFEELKKKLGEMGMFADEYKQRIPKFATKIGVVTAETGAVIRDIYNVASRRNPYCQITLYPAQVQGEGAAATICAGIRKLDSMGLDCIIIGRGGGSIEDLWCFNDEELARTIFECRTPLISAVGHETDFSISDFVADLRAPTPSAAAELAVFDYNQFLEDLNQCRKTLGLIMNRRLSSEKEFVKSLKLKLETLSPKNTLYQRMQYLEDINGLMQHLMISALNDAKLHVQDDKRSLVWGVDRSLRSTKERLAVSAEKLNGLSPLNRLSQGYAFVSDKEGHAIKSISQVEVGGVIDVNLTDGSARAEVKEVKVRGAEHE